MSAWAHRAGEPCCSHLVPEVTAVRIGLLLDMTLRDIERVLYFESFVVIDPGLTDTGKRPAC